MFGAKLLQMLLPGLKAGKKPSMIGIISMLL